MVRILAKIISVLMPTKSLSSDMRFPKLIFGGCHV